MTKLFGWSLLGFLAVLAFGVAGLVKCAHAETFSMEDEAGNKVQLLDAPCYDAPPWMGWRKAAMVYHGKSYDACWRVFGNTVLVLDSDGDATPIPVVAFKKDEGV